MLIPLLFMGDIVGRLFREFAITLSFTILISAVVSLTLTPMLAARLLKAKENQHHGRLYQFSEDVFNGIISFLRRARCGSSCACSRWSCSSPWPRWR